MKKIRITADAVLAIIRGIFEDEDVNIIVDDTEAPETWQGKTVRKVSTSSITRSSIARVLRKTR